MAIWEDYEENGFELSPLRKEKLAFRKDSKTYNCNWTCPADLEEVFCATGIVYRFWI